MFVLFGCLITKGPPVGTPQSRWYDKNIAKAASKQWMRLAQNHRPRFSSGYIHADDDA